MNKHFRISGVGSLPHPHTDSALEFSFKHHLPFVPQLPLRSKKETMIYQGLDGIGDIEVKKSGEVLIHSLYSQDRWNYPFSHDSYRCFKPFFYECEQKEIQEAKIQLAGPFTLYQYSQMDNKSVQLFSIIQDFFCKKIEWLINYNPLEKLWIQIDEPALFMLDKNSWETFFHTTVKKVQALTNQQTLIGIHCCSNCKWEELFKSKIDFLSFDFTLSAENLQKHGSQLQNLDLLMGIFDTHPKNPIGRQSVQEKSKELLQWIERNEIDVKRVILTPGCGLGHKKITEAQEYLTKLKQLC